MCSPICQMIFFSPQFRLILLSGSTGCPRESESSFSPRTNRVSVLFSRRSLLSILLALPSLRKYIGFPLWHHMVKISIFSFFFSFFFHSNIDRNKYNIRSDRREYYLIKLSLRFFVNPTKRDLNSFVESTLCNLKRMIDKSIINKDWLIANSVRVKNSEMILNFNKNRDIIVNYIWYF